MKITECTFLLEFGVLEVQIGDVCASVLHTTVLILLVLVATFTSCVVSYSVHLVYVIEQTRQFFCFAC